MRYWKLICREKAFKLLLIASIPLLVLLLPMTLPIALAADALSERRLWRTKCGTCDRQIGRTEIKRAKREAGIEAGRMIGNLVTRGLKPRVVTPWRISCPICGANYLYRSDLGQGLEAVEAA